MHTPAAFVPAHSMPDIVPPGSIAFACRGDKLLVSGSAEKAKDAPPPLLPGFSQLSEMGLSGTPHFLGVYEESACIAVNLPDNAIQPDGWHFAGLRSLFFRLPEPMLAIASRATQVAEWDRTHRFCGRCATPTRHKPGERAKECPSC